MALRTEFSPDREFVVSSPRGLIVGSTLYKTGAAFDRSLVTTRLLRQLYDARQLEYAPEQAKGAAKAAAAVKTGTRPSRPARRRRFSDGGSS